MSLIVNLFSFIGWLYLGWLLARFLFKLNRMADIIMSLERERQS